MPPILKRLCFALSLCVLGEAFAADVPNDDTGTLQEVIVTAQRREQNLQTVGTSITALDGSQLQKLGITDVTGIATQTPGMQFNQYGATVTVYNLRGVSQNDFSDHQEAPIAVYADDAYVASMGALAGALFDIQRVEVLRGPQGTLFGRNATGGLIQYISEKPKFDNDGYVTATFGNYGTVNTEGAVNTALADQIAVRASFATDYHNGYITNRLGDSTYNEKQYAGRLQFLYKPSENGEIILKIHGLNNDHETGGNYSWAASTPNASGRGAFISPTSTANCPNLSGGCTPGGDLGGYANTYGLWNQAEDRQGVFNRTVYGATLHATWNFEAFSLASVTDYLHMQKRYGEDSDISPNPIFNYDTLQDFHQLSEELHMNGTVGALKWIAGVYFLDYRTNNFEGVSLIPAFGGYSEATFGLSTSSKSVFGQLEYDLNSQFTLITGARFTSDEKSFDYSYQPQDFIYNPSTDPGAEHTYTNVTGKAELDYKFADESMLYASWNRGAKGGGWSAPSSGLIVASTLPYAQEILTSYELGEKTTFWDGRARINGALFYYDYHNYQGFFLSGLTQVVENIDAIVKGGEVELAIAPVRGANFQLGVSRLETDAKNVPLPVGGYTNTQMPQAPPWSVNAVGSYAWTIPDGALTAEFDTKWNDHEYLELLNAPVDYQASYAVSNVKFTYSNDPGHWEVSAWVKNVADKAYRVYNLDLSVIGFDQQVFGPPRTFGATFNYRWGTK